MTLLREFCAENMERVPAAIAAGAGRVELCDNLAVGGTSPSYGVICAAVANARATGTAVMAMARPRGGDFVYAPAEEQMMLDDVAMARSLGVTGVVFGCLAADPATGELVVDRAMTEQLVTAAHGALTDEAGSPMGLATIYRQMEKLETQGLVHRVASDDRNGACWKYCGADHGGACILVKCESCGAISHMDCAELPGLYRHLAEHHGFTVNPNRTLLYGTCAACQSKEANHGTDHLY